MPKIAICWCGKPLALCGDECPHGGVVHGFIDATSHDVYAIHGATEDDIDSALAEGFQGVPQ